MGKRKIIPKEGITMGQFNIPVVLFFFRRKDTIIRIIERLSLIKPNKIYLISDGPRNELEKIEVENCRIAVEDNINWDCEVVRNYATANQGVYDRIGKGAKWVFENEEKAIFLEDDNLPEISFFTYCENLLDLYKDDNRILWICGTNYLEEYEPEDKSSYVFTQHLLPCGWASWSSKFNKYYDGELVLLDDPNTSRKLKNQYKNKALYRQQLYSIKRTKYLLSESPKRSSWDHQMSFSIRINGLLGISPKVNLIKNIGVDEFSEHGGTSFNNVMTRRFCGMDSKQLNFPLIHPKVVLTDYGYEKRVGNIILLPLNTRIAKFLAKAIKPLLGINEFDSFKEWLRNRKQNK